MRREEKKTHRKKKYCKGLQVGMIETKTLWCNNPTTNGGMQNGSPVGICTRRIRVFARFGADLHARSALSDKISASELSRKLIKVASLAGSS